MVSASVRFSILYLPSSLTMDRIVPFREEHDDSTSALALFVPRIGGADHVDLPFTTDDLASFTNPLDAGTNFHVSTYGFHAAGKENYTH
jgi:hypothetical protein